MNNLMDFFQSTSHLNTPGYAVRTVVSLFLIYIMCKFLMKRAAGQIVAFDFVFLWMLGALAVAPLLDGKILFTTTVVAVATLYFWHYVTSWLTVRIRWFSNFITRKPTVLFEKGMLMERNMRRSFFNNDLLLSELRLVDAPDLAKIDRVILETSGHLSVVKNAQHTPPTPIDFQISVPSEGLPTVLINNGKVNELNVKKMNLTEDWLQTQLQKNGIMYVQDVHLATISPNGKFYYSVKNSL